MQQRGEGAGCVEAVAGGRKLCRAGEEVLGRSGSKEPGGELPLIATASLDPAYAKAAMALTRDRPPGWCGRSFGYHIIQTEQRQPAGVEADRRGRRTPSCRCCSSRSRARRSRPSHTAGADEAKKSGLDKMVAAHGLHTVTTDYLAKDGTIGGALEWCRTADAGFRHGEGCGTGDGLGWRWIRGLHGGRRAGSTCSGFCDLQVPYPRRLCDAEGAAVVG